MRIELKSSTGMVVGLDSGDRFYLRDDLIGGLHVVAVGIHHLATSRKLELYTYDMETGQDVMMPGGTHFEIAARMSK